MGASSRIEPAPSTTGLGPATRSLRSHRSPATVTGDASTRAGSVAAIVLAAGSSTRLGRPKQLLDLAGKPVLQHVLDAAAASPVDDIILVLGHMASDIAGAVRLPANARSTVNPAFAQGLASSLRTGLAEAGGSKAVVVLLGDQPGIRPDAISLLVDVWRGGRGPVVQAVYRDRPGHPTLFDRSVWGALVLVEGDEGARWLLARNPQWVARVEVGGDPPLDIDTDADYARVRQSFSGHPAQALPRTLDGLL